MSIETPIARISPPVQSTVATKAPGLICLLVAFSVAHAAGCAQINDHPTSARAAPPVAAQPTPALTHEAK